MFRVSAQIIYLQVYVVLEVIGSRSERSTAASTLFGTLLQASYYNQECEVYI